MRLLGPAALAIALLALAGCSGSGGSDDAASPAPTESSSESSASETTEPTEEPAEDPDLRAAVTAYSDAFLTGKAAAAYGLLSERCQGAQPLSEFAAIVEQAGKLYSGTLDFTSYDEQVKGDMAKVTYRYQASGIDQVDEPWVLKDGAWVNDEC